jgi:hypothetical protein
LVVFEMLSVDLSGGGQLWIFDGLNDDSTLLWSCLSCALNPPLLFASANALFIRYRSPTIQSGDLGFGFQGLYWALSVESSGSTGLDSLLLLPHGLSFSAEVPHRLNETIGWNLIVTEESSTLAHYPFYQLTPSPTAPSDVTDGRDPNSMRELYRKENQQYSCGILKGGQATIVSSSTTLSSSQSSAVYFSYNSTQRQTSSLHGSWTDLGGNDGGVAPSETCVYLLDSGPVIGSITVNVEQFVSPSVGHLRVYGGVSGTDRLLVDLFESRTKNLRLLLPCGKGLIIIDSNSSLPGASHISVDYGFKISYSLNEDSGKACRKYSESSLPLSLSPSLPQRSHSSIAKKTNKKDKLSSKAIDSFVHYSPRSGPALRLPLRPRQTP